MLYKNSIWEVEAPWASLQAGTRFSIYKKPTGYYIPILIDGKKKNIQKTKLLNYCKLVSSEDCGPVLYLKRQDTYYGKCDTYDSNTFLKKSHHTIEYLSERTVREAIVHHLCRMKHQIDPRHNMDYECEAHYPNGDIVRTKIDEDWLGNVIFLHNSLQQYRTRNANLIKKIPHNYPRFDCIAVIDQGTDEKFISQFSKLKIAHSANERVVHVVDDNPEVVTLLQLHYGDQVTIMTLT